MAEYLPSRGKACNIQYHKKKKERNYQCVQIILVLEKKEMIVKKKKKKNPNYSGGRYQEDCHLKPA
jgi:hypothetical protein